MRLSALVLSGLLVWASGAAVRGQQAPATGAPETFSVSARAEGRAGGAITGIIKIHVQRYTPDFDRTAVENALKFNGYPGFVTAIRKAPPVGYVELNGQQYTIRWARETPSGKGRIVTVVTDKPVYFVGGGSEGAKPRAGYEVAVAQLTVDATGRGTGTMAAAARVKPGGPTGVRIDDYSDVPIKLTDVTRAAESIPETPAR